MQDSNFVILLGRPVRTPGDTSKTLTRTPVAASGSANSMLQEKVSASCYMGFTLIEVMVTLVVAGILLVSAVPSLRQAMANNEITSTNNAILTGLNLARFTAVTEGTNVVICPSKNSTDCVDSQWHEGWIVYRGDITAGDFTPASDDIIRATTHMSIRDANTLKPGIGLTKKIGFQTDGTAQVDGGAWLPIDLCYADTSYTKTRRQITISPFGPISSENVATVCGS
jgi:type IV fimbrial biogenesis protein FimT